MLVLHLFIDVVLGAIVGFCGGLFGVGGGIIAIPVLAIGFGMSQQFAQGTTLVMVIPSVFIGLWRYYQKKSLNVRYAVTLAVCAAPFTYVGARIATGLPSSDLRIGSGIFTLIMGAYVLLRSFPRESATPIKLPWYYASIVGALGGTFSGFFTVGGATFAVPAMSTFFDLTQAGAQSMGLALIAPGTIVGLATYAAAHDVDWLTGIAMAVGAIPSVGYGVSLAVKLPDIMLKRLFAGFLFASSIALLTHR